MGVNITDKAIASNWGYDYLQHEKISCVTEKRLYVIDEGIQTKPKPKAVKQVTPKRAAGPEAKDFEHEFFIEWEFATKVAVSGEFNGWK